MNYKRKQFGPKISPQNEFFKKTLSENDYFSRKKRKMRFRVFDLTFSASVQEKENVESILKNEEQEKKNLEKENKKLQKIIDEMKDEKPKLKVFSFSVKTHEQKIQNDFLKTVSQNPKCDFGTAAFPHWLFFSLGVGNRKS